MTRGDAARSILTWGIGIYIASILSILLLSDIDYAIYCVLSAILAVLIITSLYLIERL